MPPAKSSKSLHRNLFNGEEEGSDDNGNPTLAAALQRIEEEAPVEAARVTNAYGITRAQAAPPTPKAARTRPTNIRPKAVFRCIPASLKSDLEVLAGELNVPMGYLAYYLFERGLRDFHDGRLPIQSHLTSDGYTLYPQEHRRAGRPLKNAKPKKDKLVGFHGVPRHVVDEIARVAGQVLVPQGEVARRLIEVGIARHRAAGGSGAISVQQLAEFVYERMSQHETANQPS